MPRQTKDALLDLAKAVRTSCCGELLTGRHKKQTRRGRPRSRRAWKPPTQAPNTSCNGSMTRRWRIRTPSRSFSKRGVSSSEAERDDTLPKKMAPADLAISEIIRRCDLAVPPCTDDISFVERYANWLSLWSYHAMPDGRVREKALDIALNELMVRLT